MYSFGVTTEKRNFKGIMQKLGPIAFGSKVNQPYAAHPKFRAVLSQKNCIASKFPKVVLVRKNPSVTCA